MRARLLNGSKRQKFSDKLFQNEEKRAPNSKADSGLYFVRKKPKQRDNFEKTQIDLKKKQGGCAINSKNQNLYF